MQKLIIGTNVFSCLAYAMKYYGETREGIEEKVEAGEIRIGKPEAKIGSYFKLDSDGRYHEHEVITRAEYMDSAPLYKRLDAGEITKAELDEERAKIHHAYYFQFATQATIDLVKRHIGEDKIKASTDKAFNDIPLQRWDSISSNGYGVIHTINRDAKKAVNEYPNSPNSHKTLYWSLSDGVCIAKACARHIRGF